MDAPSTTKGKSGSNSPTSRKFRLSRKAWFFVALGIFIISTIIAFAQPPRRNPFDAKNFHGLRWFYHPIERNAFKRLPAVTSFVINDICLVPGTKRIWIAGVGGLLAYSDDGGVYWEQPLMKEGNTPQLEKGVKGAWRILPDLISKAYAQQIGEGQEETRRQLSEGGGIPKSAFPENLEVQQQGVSSQKQFIPDQA
ncbi:MAG: hypothetical protein E3K40_05300 [Candidatus Brocadia sp.]|nr:hypothetical protein [Candidatus Brocadia sp.]MDG6026124.1 hypothetical protein [Candidatus Brocadia sp.]